MKGKNRTNIPRERSRPIRPVPTPMDVDARTESAMGYIDKLGAPPMPRAEWVNLLEEIIAQCRTRVVAAHEDAARDGEDG